MPKTVENFTELAKAGRYDETIFDRIDRRHAVFGQVFEGMDVVDAIATYPVDENAMPFEPAVILSVDFTTY